jgi:hypothetical protein
MITARTISSLASRCVQIPAAMHDHGQPQNTTPASRLGTTSSPNHERVMPR